MDFRYREALRKSRIFLLQNISFPDLLDHVIHQDIFSESMLDHIKSGGSDVEHIRRLLDHLNKRPDDCYHKFLAALASSGHGHCREEVQKQYVLSGPTQASSEPSHPSPQNGFPFSNPVQQGQAQGFQGQTPLQPTHNPVPMDEGETLAGNNYSSLSVQPPSGNIRYAFPETEAPSMSTYSTVEAPTYSTIESRPVQESCRDPSTTAFYNEPLRVERGRGAGDDGEGERRREQRPAASWVLHTRPSLDNHPYQMNRQRQSAYKMDSAPRGLVLLINNEQFKTMSPRPGSQRDQENFHYMFQLLGFQISHEQDKTADEMLALLESFAIYDALREVDALAVVILSHGGAGGKIFGKDGSQINSRQNSPVSYITADDIMKVFSARKCPLMANKPKLIIVQACRGHNEDGPDGSGPRLRRAVGSAGSSGLLNVDGPHSGSCSNSSSSSTRTADMADMCLLHSSVEGYVSYRHPQNGSPFVEELTSVFKENAHQESLTDMMTEVTRRLANRSLPEDLRTVPSTTNTLTRKWFFNPPYAAGRQ